MKTIKEAKLEYIKEAYGELWETLKDDVDEFGFFNGNDTVIDKDQIYDDFYHDNLVINKKGKFAYRPTSLKDFEENNGWIRIESDGSNLPLTTPSDRYKIFCIEERPYWKDYPINLDNLYTSIMVGYLFNERRITHYKLHVEDEPLW